MKTTFYMIFLIASVWCPMNSYSQKSRISGLERPLAIESKPKSVLTTKQLFLGITRISLPLYPSKMPILRAQGTSKILIAKLDSLSPYQYRMPIKKIDMAD
jgi:hypothetical protein